MKISYEEFKDIKTKRKIGFKNLKGKYGVKCMKLRLVTDGYSPYYDVSYLLVEYKGNKYLVQELPFRKLEKRIWKSQLISHMKENNVFLNELLNNTLILTVLKKKNKKGEPITKEYYPHRSNNDE